jgi:xylulose-5-phosphate/fructose-6-phosphate phosphoketolase
MLKLVRDFGKDGRLQSEVSPALPGTILAGGEIGAALATALGAAFNNPGLTVFCLLGDGELEAGATLPSFLCETFVAPPRDGFLIVAVNLNGYKMGSRSVFSTWSSERLLRFFESFPMEVFVCGPYHDEAARVFDSVAAMQEDWRRNRSRRIPLILFRNAKGWTGPEAICGRPYVGTHRSHKVDLLRHPHESEGALNLIEQWLRSYGPERLFTIDGLPSEMVIRNMPIADLRPGLAHQQSCSAHPAARLEYSSSITQLINTRSRAVGFSVSPMRVIGEWLNAYMGTPEGKDFMVFCPDEASSNMLGGLVDARYLRWESGSTESSVPLSKDGRVVEVLNETCCHGMLQGYNQTGRDGVYVTYEAFAPITASAVSQYYKFLKQGRRYSWRQSVPALKYIVTSLGWRNTYTHQNPDLLNTLLSKTDSLVTVYFPSDANHALACLSHMLLARDSISVVVLGKSPFPVRRAMFQAWKDVERGYWIQEYGATEADSTAFLLVALGDYMVEECIQACRLVCAFCRDCRLRVVSPISSTVLQDSRSLLSMMDLTQVLNPPLVVCTGYARVVRGLFSQSFDTREWTFNGYRDEEAETSQEVLLHRNEVGRFYLASAIARALAKSLPDTDQGLGALRSYLDRRLASLQG